MSKPYRVESYAVVDGPRELVKQCGTLREAHAVIAKALGLKRLVKAGRECGIPPTLPNCLEHYARHVGPYRKVDKSGFMIFGPAPTPEAHPNTPALNPSGDVVVRRDVWDALIKVVGQVEDRLHSIEAKLDTAAVFTPATATQPVSITAPEKPKRKFLGRHAHNSDFLGKIDAALIQVVTDNPGVLRTHLTEATRLLLGGCSSMLLFARLKGLISQRRILATEIGIHGVGRTVFKHHLPAQLGKSITAPPNGSTRA